MSMNETEIIDVYDGKIITGWHDSADFYLGLPACAVYIPMDRVDETMDELCEMVQAWRDYRKKEMSKN